MQCNSGRSPRQQPEFPRPFYAPLPQGIFTTRGRSGLQGARAICTQLHDWTTDDTLAIRRPEIGAILEQNLGQDELEAWLDYSAPLPADMTLEELRNYLWADTDEQQARVLEAHRRFQLLDKLHSRTLLSWTAARDKEQEEMAA